MTKVYLVKFSAWNKVSETYVHIIVDVFTNKKKAEIYAEYKTLKVETEKPDYLSKYDEITYKIEEYSINTMDWSEHLLKLQTKNLPY